MKISRRLGVSSGEGLKRGYARFLTKSGKRGPARRATFSASLYLVSGK